MGSSTRLVIFCLPCSLDVGYAIPLQSNVLNEHLPGEEKKQRVESQMV